MLNLDYYFLGLLPVNNKKVVEFIPRKVASTVDSSISTATSSVSNSPMLLNQSNTSSSSMSSVVSSVVGAASLSVNHGSTAVPSPQTAAEKGVALPSAVVTPDIVDVGETEVDVILSATDSSSAESMTAAKVVSPPEAGMFS